LGTAKRGSGGPGKKIGHRIGESKLPPGKVKGDGGRGAGSLEKEEGKATCRPGP